MKIIKADEKWYRAEQKIGTGILALVLKAYGSTPYRAIEKVMKKMKS